MTEKRTLWRDMTPEQKGALFLAHHEGRVIECGNAGKWFKTTNPQWATNSSYRVSPDLIRTTVTLYAHNIDIGTIDLVDGKPDPASIRMRGER